MVVADPGRHLEPHTRRERFVTQVRAPRPDRYRDVGRALARGQPHLPVAVVGDGPQVGAFQAVAGHHATAGVINGV